MSPTGRRRLAAGLWAAGLLVLTSWPGDHLPGPDVIGLDKAVHLGLYAVLGFLVGRAAPSRMRARGVLTLLAALLAFAAADELHQHWIPGRSAEWLDAAADALGVGLGLPLGLRRRPAATDKERPT